MQSHAPEPDAQEGDEGTRLEAYSWKCILLLWSLAILPMVVLTWLVAPWLIARSRVPAALIFFFSSSLGMAGQAALAWGLLRQEAPAWTLAGLRRRLWLVRPRHPGTKRESRKPFLWLVPLVGVAALGLMSPELAGQWWLLLVVPAVGLLGLGGEELFFRGLLLPRMRGRASWLSIGPVWAARRYRSNGLSSRAVHARGVTGRGVGIGIIDMPLLPDHQEYASSPHERSTRLATHSPDTRAGRSPP